MSADKVPPFPASLVSSLFGPNVRFVQVEPPGTVFGPGNTFSRPVLPDAPQGSRPNDNVTATAPPPPPPGETWNLTLEQKGTRLAFDPSDGTVVATSPDGRKSVFDPSKYHAVLGAARRTVGWDGALDAGDVLGLVRDFGPFFENNPANNPHSPVKPPFSSRVAAKKAAREVFDGGCDACLQGVATLALKFGFDPDKPDDPVSRKCLEIAAKMVRNGPCLAEPQGDDDDDDADDERDDDAE